MRGIEMDHDEALRLKAPERYLLDELDPDLRDQFEEHMFGCQDCAVDVRAGAMFIEQSKVVLAETPVASPARIPASKQPGWFSWLRPAFAAPVLALLLAVIAYQNLVQIPHQELAANQPQAVPYTSINVSTRGATPAQVTIKPGQGFALMVSIPPDTAYSAYTLELHNPAGGLQWALKIPASSPDDTRSINIPGAGLEQGTYKLAVSGVNAAGQSSGLGIYPVEVRIQQ
jgi:Putative zinc-finger